MPNLRTLGVRLLQHLELNDLVGRIFRGLAEGSPLLENLGNDYTDRLDAGVFSGLSRIPRPAPVTPRAVEGARMAIEDPDIDMRARSTPLLEELSVDNGPISLEDEWYDGNIEASTQPPRSLAEHCHHLRIVSISIREQNVDNHSSDRSFLPFKALDNLTIDHLFIDHSRILRCAAVLAVLCPIVTQFSLTMPTYFESDHSEREEDQLRES